MDVLVAALAEQSVAMRLVPSLQLFSLVEDVVGFDAVLLVPLLAVTERLAVVCVDARDAVEPFEQLVLLVDGLDVQPVQESALQLGLPGLFGQKERVVEEGGRGVAVALQVAGLGEAEEVLLLHLRKNNSYCREGKR